MGNGNDARRVRPRAAAAKVLTRHMRQRCGCQPYRDVAVSSRRSRRRRRRARRRSHRAGPKAPQAPKAFQQTRQPGDVEVDPIACWWKTDRSAVIVGERFTVVLTCGIIETDKIKAVPDFNQLEPTTVGLQPFEVVKGVRHEDIQDAAVALHPVRVHGAAHRRRAVRERPRPAGGEDHVPHPVVDRRRLDRTRPGVPAAGAADARQVARAEEGGRHPRHGAGPRSPTSKRGAFARPASSWPPPSLSASPWCWSAWRSCASSAATACARRRPSGRCRSASCSAAACAQAGRVKADAAGGWTPELAGRALTVLRIAGAVALDRPVAQPIVDAHDAAHEGQLALRKGIFRPRRSLVSTSTTPGTIARSMAAQTATAPNARTRSDPEGSSKSRCPC